MKSGRWCVLVHGGPRRRSHPVLRLRREHHWRQGAQTGFWELVHWQSFWEVIATGGQWRRNKRWKLFPFAVYFDGKVTGSLRNLATTLPVLGPLREKAEPHSVSQLGPTAFEGLDHLHPRGHQASVFPAITPTLAGCFPKFLINEDPFSPCYLCSWLHTPPLKPEGLRYNSFHDKNEYLSIWTVATARIYFKHICSEWSHCMAQSNWYVKFPE